MKNEQLLKDIGLNDIASKIYLFLLDEKKSTILDIARGTKIARTSVYSNIELLKQWELVGQAIDGKKKYIYPESPSNLINVIQIREKLAEQAVKKLLPSFEKDKSENKIKFGYGEEGFKQFANDMINSGEKDILQFISLDSLLGYSNKKFLESHWEQRKKENINIKILMPYSDKQKTEKMTNKINNIKYLREMRFLPPTVKLEMSFVVFKNKIQFFSPPNEGYMFQFQSDSFKNTMESMFNFLWGISEKF